MVHTRHSYSKDLEEEHNSNDSVIKNLESQGKSEHNTGNMKDRYDDDDEKTFRVEDIGENSTLDSGRKIEKNDKHVMSAPRRKRKTELELIRMYENFEFDDSMHRRSLRNLTRSRSSHHDDGPRKRQKTYRYKDYGSLVIRRSDRQPKKVFESYNESAIKRSIEKKHQEILELQQASMYDSIKRRRGEVSETQDSDEEDEDEDESEEDESEEEEEDEEEEDGSQKGYSLREKRPQTKIYQAATKRSHGYVGPQSPLRSRRRMKKVPQHSSISPYKRRSYKRMRRNSSTSCSSDDEAGFNRRKEKSMAAARARCLPMNFRPEDITGVLKGRDRARDGIIGSSLADVDPMTIDSKTSFADIGGLDHHIRSLKEMVVFPLLYPEIFQKFNISPPRGVLFYGPPGTGKTLVARALANECSSEGKKVAFFMRKGADCLSKWVGESERQLRLLFDQAYCMRPSIIFFDEIDGIAPVRSTRQDQIHSSIVSTLLALMDGLDSRGEIVVIGATNRLDSIDPALRRPGRFDREFLFSLPNKPAREKILGIHTASWQPKLSKEFISEVSEKCVGYCGADIKALCTEAALFALRRRYPQIYETNKKLVLDMNQIKLSVVDFKNALRSITPASHRSKTSPGRALPEQMKPLLQKYVEQGIKYLHKIFPQGKPVQDDIVQLSLNEQPENSSVNIFEKSVRSRSKASLPDAKSFFSLYGSNITAHMVNRPRLLIHGTAGNGQTSYIAPSLIFSMEHLTTHTLDLPSLFGNSAKTPEEAISTVFREARRTAPSVVYLPRIEIWWGSVGETTRATFCTLLDDIPSSVPVLFVASADIIYKELPESIQDLFSPVSKELLEASNPSSEERLVYFRELVTELVLKVDARKDDSEPGEMLEILEEAPPPQPRELSTEESQRLLQNEEMTLRELRLFLRQVTWKLLANRKFKEFTKPVDLEEVDDYLDVIKEPMDLSTVLTRINAHHYHSCAHYLEDINLIVNNCLEYNPDKDQFDRLLRNRACEMRDVAHALIHNDLDPDFEKLCLEIYEARNKRGFDEKSVAPSFIRVMPKLAKPVVTITRVETSQVEKPTIRDPTGSRFSRRVRGINEVFDSTVLEAIERKSRQKNPMKNNEVGMDEVNDGTLGENDKSLNDVENKVLDEAETTSLTNGLSTGSHGMENDEDSMEIGDVEHAKRSLHFTDESRVAGDSRQLTKVDYKLQSEQVLNRLVAQTYGQSVKDLERIYTEIYRMISKHRYEENKSMVLEELKIFVDVLR